MVTEFRHDIEMVCAFTVDESLYGLPVGETVEVVKTPRITPVPGSDPAVAGLVNLRGSVLVAVDARRRLGRECSNEAAVAVVVVAGRSRVALLVDGVSDVVQVKDADRREVPSGMSENTRELTSYVLETPAGLMSVLDAQALWRWGQ